MGLFDYLYPVVTRKNDDESKTDKQDRPHRGGRRVCDRPDRPAGDERRGMAKGRTYRPEPADDRFDDHQCGGENLDGDLDPPDRADGRPPGSLLTGISLQEFILQYRRRQAVEYVQCTSLSLDEIASRCGFQSTNTFVKQFRIHTGMPPKQYRAIHQPEDFRQRYRWD